MMKNNYFTKKAKRGISALLFLICILFANGIQAQTTYTWNPGTTGNWSSASNWLITTVNSPVTSTSTFTTTNASTSVTGGNTTGILAGDIVTGTGITTGVTVASVTNGTSFVLSIAATGAGTNLLTFSRPNATLGNLSTALTISPGNATIVVGTIVSGSGITPGTTIASVTDSSNFVLSLPSTTTVTTAAALTFSTNTGTASVAPTTTDTAIINDGICNLNVNATVAKLTVSSTVAAQGILNIQSGTTLTATAASGINAVTISGGKINNAGSLVASTTAASAVQVGTPAYTMAALDWGYGGAGSLSLTSTTSGNLINVGANTAGETPVLTISGSPTFSVAATSWIFSVAGSGKLKIAGTGFTTTSMLLSMNDLSAVEIASGTTITTTLSTAATHVIQLGGTLTNNGTLNLSGTATSMVRFQGTTCILNNYGSLTANNTTASTGTLPAISGGNPAFLTSSGTPTVTIDNKAGATMSLSSAAESPMKLNRAGSRNIVVNSGTLTLSSPATTSGLANNLFMSPASPNESTFTNTSTGIVNSNKGFSGVTNTLKLSNAGTMTFTANGYVTADIFSALLDYTGTGTINTNASTTNNASIAGTNNTFTSGKLSPGGDAGLGIMKIAAPAASTINLGATTLRVNASAAVAGTGYDQFTTAATNVGFNVSGATLDITGISGTASPLDIVVATGTGTITGTFASLVGFSSLWSVDYSVTGKARLLYTPPTPNVTTTQTALSGFVATTTSNSASQSFVAAGTNLTADIAIAFNPASTDYEFSLDNFATAGSSSLTLPFGSGTVANTTIYVRLKSGASAGTPAATVELTSTSAPIKTVALTGTRNKYYYYVGTGSLSTPANWGDDTAGTLNAPTALTDAQTVYVIKNGSATTDAAWALGTGSKVIVGDAAAEAVTLTVANTFPISVGTIDIAAASSGSNSVVWQDTTTPNFGTLNAASEVHFSAVATYTPTTTPAFGKLIIDAVGTVSFANSQTVETSLTIASGSTLSLPFSPTQFMVINSGATVTINGTVKSPKVANIFAFNIATGGNFGSIQFKDAITTPGILTLGAASTVEYSRSGSAQTISVLPSGMSYANLTLSDTGSSVLAPKNIPAGTVVNGTLTINLATPAFSTISGGANITLGNGATITRTIGALDAAPVFSTTYASGGVNNGVNVNYNGTTAISSGFEIPTATNVLNTLTIANAVGVTLTAATKVNGTSTLTSGVLNGCAANLSYANGATIVRTGGSLDAAPTFSTKVNLRYAGPNAITTGVEIPASSTVLNTLTVATTGTFPAVTLNSTAHVNNKLNLTSGTLITGGLLTLKSNATQTAYVGVVGANAAISGDVTVERNIPAGFRAYRLLSSPVTTTTAIAANWQAGTHITGTGGVANGFDATVSNAASLYTHNNASPAWTAVANTSGVLNAGSPYLVYVRGSRLSTNIAPVAPTNDAATLSATGTLTTGTIDVSSSLNPNADGYSLIGNPYQAQVDMQAVLAASTNLDQTYYYVLNPKLGTKGEYVAVDVTNPANNTGEANKYLQPGQACFVKTVASPTAAPSLSFTEANKYETTTNTQTSVFRTASVR